jgi:hypothetical protein
MFRRPKLQVPNALPRPRRQLAIRNRDADTRAYQRALNMCLDVVSPPISPFPLLKNSTHTVEDKKTYWHIVTPFRTVAIQPLAALVLGHNSVQRIAHVGTHIVVPVFVK